MEDVQQSFLTDLEFASFQEDFNRAFSVQLLKDERRSTAAVERYVAKTESAVTVADVLRARAPPFVASNFRGFFDVVKRLHEQDWEDFQDDLSLIDSGVKSSRYASTLVLREHGLTGSQAIEQIFATVFYDTISTAFDIEHVDIQKWAYVYCRPDVFIRVRMKEKLPFKAVVKGDLTKAAESALREAELIQRGINGEALVGNLRTLASGDLCPEKPAGFDAGFERLEFTQTAP